MAQTTNSTEVQLFDGGVSLTLGNPRSMLGVMIYDTVRNGLIAQGFLQIEREQIRGSANVIDMLDIFARAMAAIQHIYVDPANTDYNVQTFVDIYDIWKSKAPWVEKFMRFGAAVDDEIALAINNVLKDALPDKYRDAPEMAMSDDEIAQAEATDPELETAALNAETK